MKLFKNFKIRNYLVIYLLNCDSFTVCLKQLQFAAQPSSMYLQV